MAITTLELGPVSAPIFTFYDDDASLFSAEYTSGVDVIGIRLTVDESKCIVNYPFGPDSAEVIAGLDFSQIESSDGFILCTNSEYIDLKNLPFGTEARLYRRGRLFLKMYKSKAVKITKQKYTISFVSAIGLFENQKHLGGFYNGVRFDFVVNEIIGGAVPYTMEDSVASLLVRGGYLPYQSKRDSLQWLCFAYGVMIGRNESGDMHFQFIANTAPVRIPEEDFYEGGDIEDPEGVTAVEVTEHSYMELPTDEEVVVYDNTDGSETADNTFIDFLSNAPLHDLTVSGSLEIISSGVNWAIVSGTGILSGKKYTHSTRVLTKGLDSKGQLQSKVANLTKNTMVTVLNSENVSSRMLAYYAYKRVVKTSMVMRDQKMGEMLTGIDPFGDVLSGFLSSVHGIISTKIKGTCELISNYTPSGQGSNYTKFVVLTGKGVWNIPAEIFEKEHPIILVSVISGGHGGFRGKDGEPRDGGFSQLGRAKNGGDGGEPGPGGRVFTVSIDCAGKVSFAYQCGEGGESERSGTDTVFGEYSSADGVTSPYGVANIFTGEVYATKGAEKGVKGGTGSGRNYSGEGTTITYKGQSWVPGGLGRDVERSSASADGGSGGGAAVGANGGSGGDGDLYRQPGGGYFATGGAGGTGADAAAGDDSAILGGGGNGGHGGGGGGEGGYASSSQTSWEAQGYSGYPGKGGPGGRGGPGMILIYY